jgi:hypothetical protein
MMHDTNTVLNFELFIISGPNINILILLIYVQKLSNLGLFQGYINPSLLLVKTEENYRNYSKDFQ